MSDYRRGETFYGEGGFGTSSPTDGIPKTLKLADIEAAVEKIRGLPPAKWMLVAPDGRVWSDEDPIKLIATVLPVALPAGMPKPARVPLDAVQMAAGRESIFSVGKPYCPCDSRTFRKVAEWVERHHGITEP